MVTLTRSRTGKWFACFSCETETELLPPTDAVVGVDVGLSSFATLTGGKTIDNPRFYRRDEADLKRVQQRKDAAKNAQNWPENAKQKGILARIHERIANRRANFAHQESRKLVDGYGVPGRVCLAAIKGSAKWPIPWSAAAGVLRRSTARATARRGG